LALDFKQIFDNFNKAQDQRMMLTKALALEISDIGLISFEKLSHKAEPQKVEDLVKEQELLITDKNKMDASFQRFVPKFNKNVAYL
jgi:hypothetical protein